MSEQEPRAITTQPEDGTIDVPHTPEAEAALMQEVRERLAMLEKHVAQPEAVATLQNLNDDLEAVMQNVAATDEYQCGCTDRQSQLAPERD